METQKLTKSVLRGERGVVLEMQWRYMGCRPGYEIRVAERIISATECIGTVIDDSKGRKWGEFSPIYSRMYDISCIQNVLHIRHIIYTINCTSHIAKGSEEMAV